MALFELTLALLLAAVLLTGLARRIGAPYPSLLALAGAAIAFLPVGPEIVLEPDLALALFIAPVLFDAATDTAPRDLRRNAGPLLSLVVVMVVLTTSVVAFIGWRFGALPIAAAVALGAIVAPPDAGAASAILRQVRLPRRVLHILQGESLLNDATALLIYRLALGAAAGTLTLASAGPTLLFSALGSLIAGFVLGRLALVAIARVQDAASLTVLSFVGVFGVWLFAERTGLSPIITTVVFGMTLGQSGAPGATARTRISSYSVWETVVLVLNVLAFLIMGLQARQILERFSGRELFEALGFGCGVLVAVILVRSAYVFAYVGVSKFKNRLFGPALAPNLTAPTFRNAAVLSWCGMRGLVTLATAVALPRDFPGRDLIVLAAFIVVLGTLVLQGLTLKPLLRVLNFPVDDSIEREVSRGRTAIMQAALDRLEAEQSPAAAIAREIYAGARAVAENAAHPQDSTELDRLRLNAIAAQRSELEDLRRSGEIGDETYHRLREEIDWAELDAAPAGYFQPLATDDFSRRR